MPPGDDAGSAVAVEGVHPVEPRGGVGIDGCRRDGSDRDCRRDE